MLIWLLIPDALEVSLVIPLISKHWSLRDNRFFSPQERNKLTSHCEHFVCRTEHTVCILRLIPQITIFGHCNQTVWEAKCSTWQSPHWCTQASLGTTHRNTSYSTSYVLNNNTQFHFPTNLAPLYPWSGSHTFCSSGRVGYSLIPSRPGSSWEYIFMWVSPCN